CNEHAHSKMQTECIVTCGEDSMISINVRFLHLKRIALFESVSGNKTADSDFSPVNYLSVNGTSYQAGWQTIERQTFIPDLAITQLLKSANAVPIDFSKMEDIKYIYNE